MAKGANVVKILVLLLVLTAIFVISIPIFTCSTSIFNGINRLGLPISGGQVQSFEYTIPSTELEAGEVVGYRFYAQDTSGEWNVTDTYSFVVQDFTATTIQSTTPNVTCGDRICSGNAYGETCHTCPKDCKCIGARCKSGCCGDGICNCWEKVFKCKVDCG